MPRGFTYALYTSDIGRQYLKQVDADQVADPGRGWATWDGLAEQLLWPQRAKPRIVFGVSPTTGRRGQTIVAAATALLWTGEQTSFVVETNDPAVPQDTLVVTRRRGESFPVGHQIPALP